ncbi:hypothetical protein M9H77_11236 [Catharanthus roseus]|uniref:Uncharacterized protein n=1 Tax=Catharanthus roseus TaxID=4058 RepID=A0ACC0BE58_CATRO|nr:hypothetical protein M9H77_11236 [Catharanthus roseus]
MSQYLLNITLSSKIQYIGLNPKDRDYTSLFKKRFPPKPPLPISSSCSPNFVWLFPTLIKAPSPKHQSAQQQNLILRIQEYNLTIPLPTSDHRLIKSKTSQPRNRASTVSVKD